MLWICGEYEIDRGRLKRVKINCRQTRFRFIYGLHGGILRRYQESHNSPNGLLHCRFFEMICYNITCATKVSMSTAKRTVNWHDKVLGVLLKSKGALSAYDVLGELRQVNPKVAPPTVYRALSALADKGLVHRLESMNAYVACRKKQHHQSPVLSVCDDCGLVEETTAPQIHEALSAMAGKSGFALTRQVIELHGRCVACRAEVTT